MHYATLKRLQRAFASKRPSPRAATDKLTITVGPGAVPGLDLADAMTCRQTDVFVCMNPAGSPATQSWLETARALQAPACMAWGQPRQVLWALEDLARQFNSDGVFEHLEFEYATSALGCYPGQAGCNIGSATLEATENLMAGTGNQLLRLLGSADPSTAGAALCIVAGSRATLRLNQLRDITRELKQGRKLSDLVMVPVWDHRLAERTRISLIVSCVPDSHDSGPRNV